MNIIKETEKRIECLSGVLREKAKTVTRVKFWKIPHKTKKGDIKLKIGRYNKDDFSKESLECTSPKSELTLDNIEFQSLLKFLSENYEPFKHGIKKYIPLDKELDPKSIEHLKTFFDSKDKNKLLEFIAKNNLLPDDLISSLQYQKRINAVNLFDVMLSQDLLEKEWRSWFEGNDWVLGSEFVRILDEREIDSENISDYLMQAYDGFLDIIEIKRPAKELNFWANKKDHDNYVPSSDLTKAITQATKYIYEVELEANSVKFLKRVGYVKTIKPRCVLIFGRSHNWNDEQCEAYRILNSSFHNLHIMTYDHVFKRARGILGVDNDSQKDVTKEEIIEPY